VQLTRKKELMPGTLLLFSLLLLMMHVTSASLRADQYVLMQQEKKWRKMDGLAKLFVFVCLC
jgi:hypothetical protein